MDSLDMQSICVPLKYSYFQAVLPALQATMIQRNIIYLMSSKSVLVFALCFATLVLYAINLCWILIAKSCLLVRKIT